MIDEPSKRECAVCGIDLSGHHPLAKLCSDTCRAERARVRATQYRLDNIDAVRAKDRERARIFRQENPELSRQRVKRAMSTPEAKEKARLRMRKYYWENPEKFRERAREYWRKNPEAMKQKNANRDKEKMRVAARKYRASNPDHCRYIQRVWRLKNIDKYRRQERQRAYRRDVTVRAMRELGLAPSGLTRDEIWAAVCALNLIGKGG